MGIKSTQRIPTKEYGYVELIEVEYETTEEAILDYDRLYSVYHDHEAGLSPSEFKKAKMHMLETGEFDPNLVLSKIQAYWKNETKKSYRDLQGLEKDEVSIGEFPTELDTALED